MLSRFYFTRKLKEILFLFVSIQMIFALLLTQHKIIKDSDAEAEKVIEVTDFQHIVDRFYVYSAFYDDLIQVGVPFIRIIGADDFINFPSRPVFCFFLDSKLKILDGVFCNMDHRFHGERTSKYNLVFILCEFPQGLESTATFVSLKTINGSLDTHRLRIHYPFRNEEKYKVAACIKPLYDIEDPIGLIEWIEYQKLMGVQHFTFYPYNSSVGTITSSILASYPEVDILPWTLPYHPRKEVTTYGQLIQKADCNYRYRGVAKYVSTLDIDEFLVVGPSLSHNISNFGDLFDHIINTTHNGAKISSINFASKLSFLNWPTDSITFISNKSNSHIQRIQQRIRLLTRFNILIAHQEKYVMLPNKTLTSYAHASVGIPFHKAVHVTRNISFYFHYRKCESYFFGDNNILDVGKTCFRNTTYTLESPDMYKINILKTLRDKVTAKASEFETERNVNLLS